MQVGDKLFLDIVGPISFSQKLGTGLVHHAEQLIKRIAVANAANDTLIDVVAGDFLVRVALDIEGDLVVLNFDLGVCYRAKGVKMC